MSLNNEEWRYIEGFDERYKVSNLGRISSDYYGEKAILKPQRKREGYLMVTLYADTVPHVLYIHRLVGLAFIPNPKNKPQINHKNGKKDDNRLENLEWATRSQNMRHARDKLGLKCYNSIPIRCVTLDVEKESVSAMSRFLIKEGYATNCSITNIGRLKEKSDSFKYKGLEFEMVEL